MVSHVGISCTQLRPPPFIFVRQARLAAGQVDPDFLYTKQERVGKGNFGEVFKA